MLDNQNLLINTLYNQQNVITESNLCDYNCLCNQIIMCGLCNNNIQNCLCNQIVTCNLCSNDTQNCVCNQTGVCNTCNNNPCNCDKSMSYVNIYTSWEYIIVMIVLLLIYIPFFISYFYGTYSTWYENLKTDTENTWVIAGLWVIATIISYIGLYILWRNPTAETVARNLTIAVLFYIGNVILLAWSVIFYQFQNIAIATWITLILFIFEFWVFIYIWNIDRLAAIFLIPLVGMYLYFFYSMVHLASINDVVL